MSLTLTEPTAHEIDGQPWKEASGHMRGQLHQHLTEMDELCLQVRHARDGYDAADEETLQLYDDLLATLEEHHHMIAEQLAELADEGDHSFLSELAAYS